MDQPRFGGVTTLSLSQSRGEGKREDSKMEYGVAPCHSINQNREDAQMETGQKEICPAAEDPHVKRVMDVLWKLNIYVNVERHQMKHERQKGAAVRDDPVQEIYCKNLLLKDKKGQAYLLLCDEDDSPDLQVVKYHLKTTGNLHFASNASLSYLLRVKPGAVTPLAFIHTSAQGVRLLMDAELVARLNRDTTKLFFHPLRPELQVGLTLSQFERFLNHHGVTLEMLPSLRTYGRRYNMKGDSGKYKHMNRQENRHPVSDKFRTDDKETSQYASKPIKPTQPVLKPTEPAGDFLLQHKFLFEELKINVEVTEANNPYDPFLACKCVFMKDKKDNYYLFVCHENQKVNFSNLKMQLKPSKKITPLDSEELSSLLKLHGEHTNPFLLAGLKQPRFLVAIAENLYQRHSAVLTFPHPSDLGCYIQATLKDVEDFVKGIGHDLVTIPVTGTLESVLASTPNRKPSLLAATTVDIEQEANHSDMLSITKNKELPSSTDSVQVSSTVPAHREGNLFYRLMAPLRDWMARCIRQLILLLNNNLPSQITVPLLQRSILWQGATSSVFKNTEESSNSSYQEGLAAEQEAKLSKLKQLISEAGISAELADMAFRSRFSEAEKCKTCLLCNQKGRLFVLLSSEDDAVSDEDYYYLRKAYVAHSDLRLMTGEDVIQLLLRHEGGNPLSWAPEDLNPLLLMMLDQQTLGQIQVGVRLALYCFPETTITFDLASLGVTLRLTYDHLERMLKRQGFGIVYLP